MSYFPEPDNYIRDKVNIGTELSNYSTEEGIEHGHGGGTSNVVDKKDFVALKAEVDKAH